VADDSTIRLINRFIIRLYKYRIKGTVKATAKGKLIVFIRDNNKRWTPKLNDLFETTWRRKIPSDIEVQLRKKIVEKQKPITTTAPKMPPKTSNIKTKQNTPKNKDIDSELGPDIPLFDIKPTRRICAKCQEAYMQTPEYPSRMLCPACKKACESIFSINNVIATDQIKDSEVL